LFKKRFVLTNLTIAINLETSIIKITRTTRIKTKTKSLKIRKTINKIQLLSLFIKFI